MKKIVKKFFQYLAKKSANKIEFGVYEESEVVCRKYKFYGKVQNVGFRPTTSVWANKLKLAGEVKNMDDGTVELIIQGQINKINALIDAYNQIDRIKITKVKVWELECSDDRGSFL